MLRRTCALLSIAVALSLYAATVAATTAQRTFVASTGNDANPCSITAPCRNFARAITQTAADGEVIVLDSAGYGSVTITQSVSIIASAGIYAGISVFSGDGITINGSNIVVTLRGLTINGQGGDNGIVFTSGKRLIVDRCTISNMASDGILLKGTSPIQATLTNVRVEGSNEGIWVSDNSDVLIADSQISYSKNDGVLIDPITAGSPALAHIERTIIDHNGFRAIVVDGLVGSAVAYITGSQLVRNNGSGLAAFDSALVYATDAQIVGNFDRGVSQFTFANVVLSNNVISYNLGGGVVQSNLGSVFTMQNNTIRDNPSGNIIGGPLSPLTFD